MKKQTKRLVAVLLLIAVLLSSITIGKVNATSNDFLTVEDVTFAAGTDKVVVNVVANKDIVADDFSLVFKVDTSKLGISVIGEDSDGYDLYDIDVTSKLPNALTGFDPATGEGAVGGYDFAGTFTFPAGEVIATITFNVLDGLTDSAIVEFETDLNEKINGDNPVFVENSCTITKITPVTGVTLDKVGPETVSVGDEVTLTATVTPDDATDKTVTWTSSDSTVAKVENGVVTALKAGNATITAKAGNAQATCQFVVKQPLTDASLSSAAQESLKNIIKGTSYFLKLDLEPADASDVTVEWTSKDSNIASVEKNDNGYYVKAIAEGNTEITFVATDYEGNEVTKTYPVEVSIIPIDSIAIDKQDAEIVLGDTLQLGVVLNPEDTTEELEEELVWSIDNEEVATIDENGVVTAVGLGTANVTVKSGNMEATTTITVVEKTVEPEVPVEPETPAEEEKEDNGTPHTADIAIEVVAVLMLVSLAGIVYIVRKNRK